MVEDDSNINTGKLGGGAEKARKAEGAKDEQCKTLKGFIHPKEM